MNASQQQPRNIMSAVNSATYNYAPSAIYANPQGPSQQQTEITSAVTNLTGTLTQPGAATPTNLVTDFSALAAAISQDPTLQRLATLAQGYSSLSGNLNSVSYVRAAPGTEGAMADGNGGFLKTVQTPGRLFGAAGAVAGTAAQLTGNRTLGVVSQGLNGVSDTMRAAATTGGAAAGASTGIGAALGLAGNFIKGQAGKLVNAASAVASSVGNILSKATTLGSGIIGGVAGLAGALIGGQAGQKISAVGSIATGALMAAANPILGAVSIIGGLMGLFGGRGKSKFSEQMAADFKGDGSQNDVMTRAAKGKNNNLLIQVADGPKGELVDKQTIKLPGRFNKQDQSRMAQTADVTGDGKSDIVWQDKNRISVFVNRGDGTFGNQNYKAAMDDVPRDAEQLKQYGQVLKALDSNSVRSRHPKGGAGESMTAAQRESALRKTHADNGGEARLGGFDQWAAKLNQGGNLQGLREQFKAEGEPGSFTRFVATKLEALGVQQPEALKDVVGNAGDEKYGIDAALRQATGDRPAAASTKGHGKGGPGTRTTIGSAFEFTANSLAQITKDKFAGSGSDGAANDGSGVSLATQTLDVGIDNQKPGQLFFWDVNGDSANDLVFGGEGVQGFKTFLNKGDGTFDNDAIDMAQPTEQDWGQLVLQDMQGRAYLNADFAGDGLQRMQAVYVMGQWMAIPTQTPAEQEEAQPTQVKQA
jgi:hypothetical protein